jgi:macrolide transport system ATP-binding/permease protein
MPDWPQYVRQNLQLSHLRPEREAEIVEDLAAQLDEAYAEALRRGLTNQQAEAAAMQHVADWAVLANELVRSQRGRESAMTILQHQAEDRDAARRGRFSLLTDFRQDLRYAFRVLAKSPGFTAIAVLTLALGIGANTAIFSLIDAVMLHSLPVRDPQQLVVLQWNAHHGPKMHSSSSYGECLRVFGEGESSGCSLSKPFIEDVRAKTDVFSGLATFASAGRLTVSGNGPASQAITQYVSGDYFETLGVRAAAGRVFQPSDDTPSSAAVIVLNYGYWKSEFGGDPSAIGKTIHLQNLPFTIVGVAEASFVNLTPGSTYDLWIPLAQRPRLRAGWNPRQDDEGSWWMVAVARLRPGIARAHAESEVSLLFRNDLLHGEKPLSKAEDDPTIKLLLAQTGLTGSRRDLSKPLYVLMLAVGIVLLIACANVAGLMLARAASRQKEIAVRLAIGASRSRIVRQLLTESLAISIAGGLLGIAIAFWSARALLAFLTSTSSRPSGFSSEIDLRVLAFTAGVSILTGILFGLAPALRSMRVDLTPALKEGGKPSGNGGVSRRWLNSGNALVVAQVALTVVVLVGAGLLVHTLENLHNIDPGFDANNVLNFGVDATLTQYKGEQLGDFFRQLRDRFNEIPGVLSASYSDDPLLSGSLSTTGFNLHGKADEKSSQADMLPVGPEFFQTMKIPLLTGRDFTPPEYVAVARAPGSQCSNASKSQTPVAAVVNESFVHAYFPTGSPIGLRFGGGENLGYPDSCNEPGWQIVGIVHDAKYSDLRREIHPTFYVPSGEDGTFELRTAGDPRAAISAVRDVLQHSGFDLPLVRIITESKQIDNLLFQERMIARLSSFFGLLALLLACIGLYGLLSYEVARRTREIGIRMALGAQSGDVLRSVVGHGIALAAIGAAIGTAASFGVTRFLGSMLYDVKPSDPLTLVSVTVLLLLVALAACYIPARRATRVDPLVALRYE